MHKQKVKSYAFLRETGPGRQYLTVFLTALVLSAIIYLPFLIIDKGIFVYYGDYNVQQIPFYQMCHDMIRSGEVGWNWYTDLGSNFVGSYAFYLLGSPFFWLTIPFPSGAVPYLMAPLMMLKIATAAATSFGYIRRFVRNPDYAFLGALMYAFSGYSIYNIFFNHFHEVIAFFPLLLIAMEEYFVDGRRGAFPLAVGLLAIVNYYFFFGEVIFCVLYFIVCAFTRKDYKVTAATFFLFALEAVLGLILSAVLLLPAILMVLSNPRLDNWLLGWSGLLYGNEQRYGLILSSLFYPPDVPAYPNLFPDSNAKWSSVSLYLPLFSTVGLVAFLKMGLKKQLEILCSDFSPKPIFLQQILCPAVMESFCQISGKLVLKYVHFCRSAISFIHSICPPDSISEWMNRRRVGEGRGNERYVAVYLEKTAV